MLQDLISGSRPVLFIQQSNDKTGSYVTLINYLSDNKSVTTEEITGSDHMYNDVNQLKNIIESWHKKTSD